MSGLDYVIKLDNNVIKPIVSKNRLRNVSLFLNDKSSSGKDYIIINDPNDLDTYTDNPNAKLLFSLGFDKLLLVFTPAGIVYADRYTASLIILDDKAHSDTGLFSGVKYMQVSDKSYLVDGKESKSSNTCVVYHDLDVPMVGLFCANMVNINLNPNWSDLQYKIIKDYTIGDVIYPVESSISVDDETDITKAREQHLSFLYSDGFTVVDPSIYYFRAGGLPIGDNYKVRNLIYDLQFQVYKTLNTYAELKKQFIYNNANIKQLESDSNSIIEQYIEDDSIKDGRVEYPSISDQGELNVANGLVSGVKVSVLAGSAIWYITGDVYTTYSLESYTSINSLKNVPKGVINKIKETHDKKIKRNKKLKESKEFN